MADNDPDFSRYFGRAILEARRRKGLTQTELAAAVGLAKSRVSILEKHGRGLTGDLPGRIAKALGTTTVELGDVAYEWMRRDLVKREGPAAASAASAMTEGDGGGDKGLAQAVDLLKRGRDILDYLLRAVEYSVQHEEILAPVAVRRRSRELGELPPPPEPRKRSRKGRKNPDKPASGPAGPRPRGKAPRP